MDEEEIDDLRRGVDQDRADQIHAEVVVVEGAVLAEGEAGCEDEATEWEERHELEAFVVAGCVVTNVVSDMLMLG